MACNADKGAVHLVMVGKNTAKAKNTAFLLPGSALFGQCNHSFVPFPHFYLGKTRFVPGKKPHYNTKTNYAPEKKIDYNTKTHYAPEKKTDYNTKMRFAPEKKTDYNTKMRFAPEKNLPAVLFNYL
jgi:hypothetical protein